ncbi:MAG: ankyrin repeat domain-containing protein [Spirochaetales bacterium]|nr:ankyrin repeat domain-containing protein [Spirochaetales bacterium]
MYRISRHFVFLFILLLTAPYLLCARDTWSGPELQEDFRFDKMDLYAIGWSEKGEFAYGIVSPSESGAAYWQWYILDLIDDVLLFESPRWTLLEGQTPAELWERHPEWYPQLIRFGITPGADFLSGGQIFQHDGSSYRMSYTLDRSESEMYPGGMTKNIRIDLFRNNSSGKTVYNYSPSEKDDTVEDMILKGYILSPFEKRTAIVALEKSAPQGETPRWRYRIIGAHLTVGFSAVKQQGSALAEAVLNGQFYVSRMLLGEGADPDSRDSRGYTPLLIAARLGHWEIAGLLIDAGAVPGQADDRGRRALHYAAEAGEEQTVRLLLGAGARKNLKDLNGQTPADLAAAAGYSSVRKLLR